jgi:hypothetical protein
MAPQPDRFADISHYDELFTRMRDEYKWNVEEPMIWSFFFTHDDAQESLQPVADHLQQTGYTFIRYFRTDGDHPTNFLHVDRIEEHTPASLRTREIQLFNLAEEFAVTSYDGYEVGPVTKAPK